MRAKVCRHLHITLTGAWSRFFKIKTLTSEQRIWLTIGILIHPKGVWPARKPDLNPINCNRDFMDLAL